MEAISVKVNYNNKTINIGKGIQSENRIFEELEKRFGEVKVLRPKMRLEFEGDVYSLKEALQISQFNGKKTTKVKVIVDYVENCDMTMQIDLLENDFKKEMEKQESEQKPSTQAKEEVKEEVAETSQYLKRSEVRETEQSTEPKPFVRKSSFQSINSKRSSKAAEESNLSRQNQIRSNLSQSFEFDQEPRSPSEKSKSAKSNIIKAGKSVQKPNKQQTEQKVPSRKDSLVQEISQSCVKSQKQQQTKRQVTDNGQILKQQVKVEKTEGYFENLLNSHDIPKDHPLIKVIDRRVEEKTTSLQKALEDLTQKYNTLMAEHQKKQCLQKKIEKYGYKAQIIEKDRKEEAEINSIVVPMFDIINQGPNDWPEEVYAVERGQGEMTKVDSLKAGERVTVKLPEIKCANNGREEMGRNYQLAYKNEKGDLIFFGRVFGVFFKVVPTESSKSKILPSIFDMSFKEEPQTDQAAARKLMNKVIDQKKRKLNRSHKKNRDIIDRLELMGINEKNFNEFDGEIVEDIIRTI